MSSENSSEFDHPMAHVPARDPYEVLNVARRADDQTIKRAYFQMVRQYPPEREPEQFQTIRTAYEQLRTPDSRALTDLFLLQPPPELPNRRRPQFDLSIHCADLAVLAMAKVVPPMDAEFQDISL